MDALSLSQQDLDNQALIPNAKYIGLGHANLAGDWKNKVGMFAAMAHETGIDIPKRTLLSTHLQNSWTLQLQEIDVTQTIPLTQEFTMTSRAHDFICAQFSPDRAEDASKLLKAFRSMEAQLEGFPDILYMTPSIIDGQKATILDHECATTDILPESPEFADRYYTLTPYRSEEHLNALETRNRITHFLSNSNKAPIMPLGQLTGSHTANLYPHAGSRDFDLQHNEKPIISLTRSFELNVLMNIHSTATKEALMDLARLHFRNLGSSDSFTFGGENLICLNVGSMTLGIE